MKTLQLLAQLYRDMAEDGRVPSEYLDRADLIFRDAGIEPEELDMSDLVTACEAADMADDLDISDLDQK